MKRSEINAYILEAIEIFERSGFKLPPFAYWTPEQWLQLGDEADEIRINKLGWDITDFGLEGYREKGLLLFTIRNGSATNSCYPKGYAEKIMIVKEDQVTPWHYHWNKREDIINRNGGELVVELYNADENNRFSKTPVQVSVDGIRRIVPAGGKVILTPGESICLEPYMYHTFYANSGKGTVVVGEVSDVNDDNNDNCFYDKLGRFPLIVEDEAPLYYLCTEYPPAKE